MLKYYVMLSAYGTHPRLSKYARILVAHQLRLKQVKCSFEKDLHLLELSSKRISKPSFFSNVELMEAKTQYGREFVLLHARLDIL